MRFAFPLLLLGLLGWAAAASEPAQDPDAGERTAPQRSRAARMPPGAEACVDCHPKIVADYAETGMARALGPLEPGEFAGLEPVEFEGTGFTYAFEESRPDKEGNTKAWIVETWTPPDGDADEAVRSSARLAYAIGAGELDRSYVAEKHGLHWLAPLEVFSAGESGPRRAERAPGHFVVPTLRLDTPIAEECLACHTDQLARRQYPRNLAPAERERWEPSGISCGACHGDVQRHALWRDMDLSGESPPGRDPILSWEDLDLVERVSVCARCHLQGDARIALDNGERGIPPPGGNFLEQWAVYVPERPDDDIGFVSQVERMTASPCFVRSQTNPGTKMSCEVCHDPHRSIHEPRERQRVRQGCLECHERFESSAKGIACSMPPARRTDHDCVGCHMRTTEVFDLAHVRITDHKVERRLLPPSEFDEIRIKHTRDGRLKAFAWAGMGAPSYAQDAGLKMMAAIIAGFPKVAAEHIAGLSSPEVHGLATYQHLRGVLLEQLGRDAEALTAYRRAQRIDPDSHDTKVNLALMLGRNERAADGLEMLDRLLERFPRATNALRNRAVLRYQTGDAQGFSADLEAALAILPSGPVARALSDWYAKRGVDFLAERWLEEARRLDPHVPVRR